MTRSTARSLTIMIWAMAVLAGGVAGCSKEETAPQPAVRKDVPKVKTGPAAPAKPADAAVPKPETVVFYNPAGKRDPFVPFMRAEQRGGRAGLANVPPLQRYELSELRFVGVIWGAKGNFALIEDGEGRGYTVVVGTRIGRGGGVVTRVLPNEIFVKEEFEDYTGSKVVRESSMKLQTGGK